MKQPFSPLPLRWAPRQCTFLNFDVNFKNCCDFYKKFIIEHVLQRVAATLHGLECHRFGASLSRNVLQRVAVTLHGLECHRFGASLSRNVLQRVAVTLHGLECHRFGASLSRNVLQRVAVPLHGLECHRFGASLSRNVLQRVAVPLHGLECRIDCQNSHKFHFHFCLSFGWLNSALLVLKIAASSSLWSRFSTCWICCDASSNCSLSVAWTSPCATWA